ncbi:zinc finger protein 845-like [Formica exsecta]|uniref:zinc finger protein 845-like n=1 Tax=Formica exsecta TaxID=72781 RepID=UPI0011446649|nr:zinc finger protein 845-like [Formica exsecta]
MDAVEINTSGPPQSEDAIASAVKICRVCLLDNLMMRDLFLESEVASLSMKAMSFTNVKMLPDDGLPAQVCCVCADKLESAYEFKLQVEQADSVLRNRFIGGIIKEELFLNEVEIHLDDERNDDMEDMNVSTDYEPTVTVLPEETDVDKNFLKEQLMILENEKLTNVEGMQQNAEQDNSQEITQQISQNVAEESQQELVDTEDNDIPSTIEESRNQKSCMNENITSSYIEAIPTEEHDYIMQQQCVLPTEQFPLQERIHADTQVEQSIVECQQTLSELDQENRVEQIQENQAEQIQGNQAEQIQENRVEQIQENRAEQIQENQAEQIREAQEEQIQENQSEQNQSDKKKSFNEEMSTTDNEPAVGQDSSQNETRRSKRRLARRTFAERDSDEENYFENLNLSSRLKKAQADKAEKIFFMCYLCDKQFLSKSVLKEHMHSHEEVRKALSLKKTPEKPQKIQTNISTTKTPPSGKKANKCPYCGKEYLYIISFTKHIKQHEREREEAKEDPMPLEISFHEDEHSLDFDGNNSDREYRKRTRRGSIADGNDDATTSDNDQDKKRKRNRVEEFACDKCPEKFDTKRSLQKHSLTHVSFKCNVCHDEYDTLVQLRNHRTKHVVEGVLTEQDLEEDMKQMMAKSVENYDDEDNKNDEEEEEYNDGESAEHAKELKCQKCPMTFSRKKLLSRHMETAHSGVSSYDCKICRQQFTRKDLLRRHAEQHARIKTYKCTQCNKTFGNELTLRNHLVATNHKTFIHGQEYDPNKRIKRVAAKAAQKIIDKIKTEDGLEDYDDDNDNVDYDAKLDGHYYRRKRDATPKNYKKELECATCNKRYSSKQALTKHMEQHVKDEKAAEKLKKAASDKKETQKTNNTTGDNDDDDDDSDFESGLDWPMDSHECGTCKKRYSTKKSLLRHQLLHEEPNFECDICNVKFYRKDKLKAHYDKCSEKNPDQVRKCNICGDSFENNEILREHRAKHVTEGILTEEDLRDIEPKPEEKKPGEKIGRKRRTDIVGLECTECNKQYTSRKGLLRHIQVHEGKKYLCDICPKKFYRREHLKIHVAKHNMIKPYKCTRCTKRFIKEEQLNNHLSKHDRTFKKNKETDSSKRFLCEICSKSFTQSTTLIAHLRAHNGIKPYVCQVCSRPFTTNAYLKMHMRTHTQERPYICQYCSRAFARADTLANHLTSHTGEAKYHCKCCPKNFRRLKSLKEHMFIHTGQRPYECPTCDRKFNNNGSRYAHSKRCKQNLLQNQNRAQQMMQQQVQPQPQQQQQQSQVQIQVQQQSQVRMHQTTLGQAQIVKAQNIKTIAIARQAEPTTVATTQQVMQQEILMPLILPLTVTLADVGEEVILPEGTKIFTTS